MKRLLLLLAIVALCSSKLYRQPFEHKDWKTDTDYQWFEQELDHFDMQNKDTFKARYWVNDQYWSSENGGGPLFLYLCGEWTCSNQKEDSYVMHLAKEHGAMLVVHEHRYYGMSQPFDNWNTENLKWLNTDQALADVAKFATTLSEQIAKEHNVPVKRWFVIGGSYPGALVSWFRNKYPHVAFGAWSSSGVVDAVQDFHQFDEQVTASLMKSGDACPQTIRGLVDYTNSEFAAGRGDAIKSVFNAPDMADDEFFWFYSDVIAETVQYGGRTELCERVSKLGKDYPAMNQMLNDWQVGQIVGRDDYWSVALKNTTIDFGKNGRQWTYQYCSELGYLQTPAQKYPPLKNKAMTLDFWKNYCTRIFEKNIFPDTHLWNLRYGGKNPAVSKVIYMNGDEDPWKQASILETKNIFVHTFPLDCDNCAHCVDLRSPVEGAPKEVDVARKHADRILGRWIRMEKKMESENTPMYEREVDALTQIVKE